MRLSSLVPQTVHTSAARRPRTCRLRFSSLHSSSYALSSAVRRRVGVATGRVACHTDRPVAGVLRCVSSLGDVLEELHLSAPGQVSTPRFHLSVDASPPGPAIP